MPVERIYGASPPYGTHEEPGEAVSIIEVTWGRHGTPVQIATKCVRRDDGTDYHPPLEAIEMVHAGTGLPVEGASDLVVGELLEAEGIASSGFYADFDRNALNQLIRVLRRARNAEYGSDE